MFNGNILIKKSCYGKSWAASPVPPIIIMFQIKVTANVTKGALLLPKTNISLAFCIVRLKGCGAVKDTLQKDVLIFSHAVRNSG